MNSSTPTQTKAVPPPVKRRAILILAIFALLAIIVNIPLLVSLLRVIQGSAYPSGQIQETLADGTSRDWAFLPTPSPWGIYSFVLGHDESRANFDLSAQEQLLGFYRQAKGTAIFRIEGFNEGLAKCVIQNGHLYTVRSKKRQSHPKWHGKIDFTCTFSEDARHTARGTLVLP